ncbi:cell division protein [Candidatus Berkelbacteria bacterium CG10_big_fil_rev_8_21_14_0_10_41_12]|uniref:Cell division protein n=1 Tax=Candidatus Berkelbacteria bacterium CG10_big_fil_rev_8_21_14_0_10_41_12 TaxID=1974513 RepID=A0A2M6WWM2_9BACT|nr:MAG: cell division protein [Candidatus Berkelbacteria bacterium CG10_big_fil_rev_8_21_14_0_10_41_12]
MKSDGRRLMKQEKIGTVVGSTVHLTGALKDSSEINIFGSIEGEISSETKVVIEDTAMVKGPITAPVIIISGFIKGSVIAQEKLELNSSGKIHGNIETSDLLIHSGATFIGKCTMPNKEDKGTETGEEIENEQEGKDSELIEGGEKEEDE